MKQGWKTKKKSRRNKKGINTKEKKKIGWETVKWKWKDINETIRKKIDDKRTETYNIHKKLKRHRYIEI